MYSLILKWKGQFRRGKAANVERKMRVVNLVQGKVASARELTDSSVYIRIDSGSALTHNGWLVRDLVLYQEPQPDSKGNKMTMMVVSWRVRRSVKMKMIGGYSHNLFFMACRSIRRNYVCSSARRVCYRRYR